MINMPLIVKENAAKQLHEITKKKINNKGPGLV